MASTAAAAGRKSLTATSLFSFFLSKSIKRKNKNHACHITLQGIKLNQMLEEKQVTKANTCTYNPQRSDGFQPGDVGETGGCQCSACIRDHQHIQQ